MEKGIRIEGGNTIGKTIIFAKSHRHAEVIKQRFNILFPELGSKYAYVMDYSINYFQIDRTSLQ